MIGFHTFTPVAAPLLPSNTCALARRERAVAEVRRGHFRRAGLQPGHKPAPANIFFSLYLGEMVVAEWRRGRFRRAGLQPGHKPTPANIFFSLSLGVCVATEEEGPAWGIEKVLSLN